MQQLENRSQFIVLSIHQRSCPVELRERLAFGADARPAALAALRQYADEGFILSTCNRVTVGGLAPEGAPALLRFLADWHGAAAAQAQPYLDAYTGPAAVRHLFRLAAGLDSMVLGEDQIQTQLKGALAEALAAAAAGPLITRLLQHALAAGKLVRSETGIARQRLSVVSVALEIARAQLGGLAGRRVLLLGAGRMAELALKHLRGESALVTLVNRSPARAQVLAAAYAAQARPFEQLAQALPAADLLVSCTAAPGYVLTHAMLAAARRHCASSLLLLDLAVPRDIDPLAAQLPGVELWDVDRLQVISAAHRAARVAEVEQAEALVAGEVAKFEQWWATQGVIPTIRALRERAEAIRSAELERTLGKLAHLAPHEQAAIGALSMAIINKLLHQPISALKNPHGGEQLAQALHELFRLG